MEKQNPRDLAVAAREEGASLLLWKHNVMVPHLDWKVFC